MKICITVAVISASLLTGLAPVRAETETPPPRSEPATTTTETFGGQVVLADLVGVAGSIVLAAGTQRPEMLLAYPLAAPAVHVFHGDGAGALGSLALHVGAPVAFAFVGLAIDSRGCDYHYNMVCGLGGFMLGTLIGLATATTVDALWLASVTHEAPARRSRSLATPTIALAPRGGLLLGLAGRL
jgi:hypothetical protein